MVSLSEHLVHIYLIEEHRFLLDELLLQLTYLLLVSYEVANEWRVTITRNSTHDALVTIKTHVIMRGRHLR
jgi:hypothetical protein